jgi:hypothetical protein
MFGYTNNKVVVTHEPECVNEEKDGKEDRNSEERINHGDDETTCEISDDRNHDGKFSQINNMVVVKWNMLMKKKGGNKDKTVILEQTQDTTDKTLLESVYKTV